jgi:pimeloyl-ACP methyl ester carboxylesterase
MSEPLSLYVNANRIRTHFYVAGAPNDRTPVVLVHGGGIGGSATPWLGTMRALASDRQVYAPESVGFGDSIVPQTAYSSEGIIAQLTAFMDALCLPRVFLVGHSLGGTIVARMAVADPKRYAGVVMVAPGGGALGLKYHSDGHVALSRALDDPSEANIRALATLMRANREHIEADVRKRMIAAATPGHLEAMRGYAAGTGSRGQAPSHGNIGLDQTLSELAVPLMLMWGKREAFNPADLGDQIAAKLPNLRRYEVFDDAGHYIHTDAPEQCSATLKQFFAEVEET